MPAIRINAYDEDLAEKAFHTIMKNCRSSYLPEDIYVISERDFEWLTNKNLPIKVLSEEEVRKSVADFKKKEGLL